MREITSEEKLLKLIRKKDKADNAGLAQVAANKSTSSEGRFPDKKDFDFLKWGNYLLILVIIIFAFITIRQKHETDFM